MPAITIDGLRKNYKSLTALDGISLEVEKGELFAYLGPNGAGKTTTIRILTGMTRFEKGQCTINGFDIRTDENRAKAQYGLVSQAINLDQELSVKDNLLIHGLMYGMKMSDIKRKTEEMLDYVDMSDRLNSPVKALSGGLKRRLMIARALLHDPAILFLDEPTVGLDAAIRRRIWGLIKKIQANGTTVFLTTHYIEEAEFLADRVAFLDKGRVVTLDTPENLMQNIGAWAIDRLTSHGMDTVYFKDRQTAQAFNMENAHQYTLRRVNLEDAFLAETGRKTESQQTKTNSGHTGHSSHSGQSSGHSGHTMHSSEHFGHSEHSGHSGHSTHSH